jgi:N-acetyl sugar amidotransferase
MPDSRPRITFDSEGVCNACRYADTKAAIDWNSRRKEFEEIIDGARSKNPSKWDCIVPWSGGKDSTSIALRLKNEFGVNPLLVTFSPLIPNEVGQKNRSALLDLGFDSIMMSPSRKVSKHLARRFFVERGNQKVHWDAGVNAAPLQLAVALDIPLVFYAEHGESEYGGRVLHEQSSRIRDFSEVLEHQIGDDPSNWEDDVVSSNELYPYLYPNVEALTSKNIRAFYFAHFFKWSMYENWLYVKDRMKFETASSGRTQGTFTNFDSLDDKTDCLYYYMQYIKFGFGRATRDACRMIQNGQMTREQGLEYARLYDAEFPSEHLRENLEFLGMSEAEFYEIVDMHRNEEIWTKEGQAWVLRNPPE